MNINPEKFICRECNGSGVVREKGFITGACPACDGYRFDEFRYKQTLADKAVDEAWERNR